METEIFVILKPVAQDNLLVSIDDMFYTYNGAVRTWDTFEEAEEWREEECADGRIVELPQQ